MPHQDQIEIDLTEPLLTPEEQKVWLVLRSHNGKAAAILGPAIAEATDIPYKQVQKIVSGLICHHGFLIGSGTCGYYIPETPQEVVDATHYLRHRAIVALHRASKVQGLSMDAVYGQAKMEFEKAS